jgi:hypothetical protein
MKILFSALHFAYFRNFESVVRELAGRGHQVHLAADEAETFGGQALVERLAAEHDGITWGWTPSVSGEPWFPAAQKIRFALDYVRFLDPRYDDAPKLRLRNIERAPRLVRWLTAPVAGARPGRSATETGLKAFERLMPRSAAMERWIAEQAPDVILLASLTFSRSTNIEQLKVARAAGIPVAACVMSWDHLSSKALLHIAPDLALVWNDVQRHEAIDMHGIAGDRVAVTGAQCYDQWFARQPAQTREDFCRSVGLAPDRPFVLYVCSAMSPVPDPIEPLFVKRWVEAIRASDDPVLRRAGVLVRPHPERVKEWTGVTLDGIDNVVVCGRNPIDGDAKAEYFDSLYHSAAVAGLCTTAFLEAAIVGRPVLTLLLPEYRIHQEGMAHFRYLLNVEGGLLITAPGLQAHLTQLSAALSAPPGRDDRNRRFLTAFVRPQGLDRAATPLFVDSVERLAAAGRRAADERLTGSQVVRGLVGRVAVAANAGVGRWLMMDAIDDERVRSEREGEQYKHALLQGRTEYRDAKRLKREAVIRATEEERRTKQWKKWLRGLSARKQIARLKGGVKQLIGARHS